MGLQYIDNLDLYEQSPDTRIIQLDGKRLSLPFPYVYFRRSHNTLYAAFSTKPVKSDNDFLCWPALPNIYEGLNVCQHIMSTDTDIDAINKFWHSGFGSGSYHATECRLVNEYIGGFRNWAKIRPSKILKCDFPRAVKIKHLGDRDGRKIRKRSWLWGWRYR